VHVAPPQRARGIDVSSYQSIGETMQALYSSSVSFAFVKATQGLGYVNPLAASQIKAAQREGALVGLYHFLDGTDGTRQWDHFEATIGTLPAAVMVAVDYETSGLPVNAIGDAICRAFIKRGRQRGYHVGVYGDSEVAPRSFGQAFTWAAAWGPSPPPYRWDFWQFADRPICDWNVFRGNAEQLHAFVVQLNAKPLAPRLGWWVHDQTTNASLGPYMLVGAAVAALAVYALRHPRSRSYSLERR
jgi:GH25 family lysozyme M1 (1,4-beta-N-acetylmuramidase)